MGAQRLFESLTGFSYGADSATYNLAVEFFVTKQAWLTHIWFMTPDAGTGDLGIRSLGLWEFNTDGSGQSQVVSRVDVTPTENSIWTAYVLEEPYELDPSKRYRADQRLPASRGYAYISDFFGGGPGGGSTGTVSDFLIAPPAEGGSYPAVHNNQGAFSDGGTDEFPDSSFNHTNYGVDVTVTDVDPNVVIVNSYLDVLIDGVWERAEVLGLGNGSSLLPVEVLFSNTAIDGGTPDEVDSEIMDGGTPDLVTGGIVDGGTP